jgi:hypothetical protein
MTTSSATLHVDTLTTEDRSVLERVLGCSLDGLKSIEVQKKPVEDRPLTEEEAEAVVGQFGKVFEGFTDEEIADFDASIRRDLPCLLS